MVEGEETAVRYSQDTVKGLINQLKMTGSRRFVAKSKPNYRIRKLDPVLEELLGNKLELIGPILDGFQKEVGLSIHANFGRSRMTGLMVLVVLFMPFQIFRHLWVLVQGYGGALKPQGKERKQH